MPSLFLRVRGNGLAFLAEFDIVDSGFENAVVNATALSLERAYIQNCEYSAITDRIASAVNQMFRQDE